MMVLGQSLGSVMLEVIYNLNDSKRNEDMREAEMRQ